MLPDWLIVVILGIIEGITEFIPVSSTGHLLVAEHWLGGQRTDLFNVVIQCGAVLAVLPLFRDRITMLLRWREPESRLLTLKILAAFFITGVGGMALKKLGYKLPEEYLPVAIALLVGGVAFILVEAALKGRHAADSISWPVVIAVAVGQLVAAVFPGASRSGSTIIFAMALGTGRVAATEFSFLVGIPTMLAAGALEIREGLKEGGHEQWGLLGLGFVVAAVVSFVAVKWLLRYVQTHTFVSFGIYRILFGLLLLGLFFAHR
ncbi:MAG: undecaprenyl-diphosphate phosphatase [Terrimicrobiaceae bacterium]|nr:undecaprenyl-diphosphate phosphatase [Terrimicrobiaceae bacterium]